MIQAVSALTYLSRAAHMAREKAILPWVLIPALFNLILFGSLYYSPAPVSPIGFLAGSTQASLASGHFLNRLLIF